MDDVDDFVGEDEDQKQNKDGMVVQDEDIVISFSSPQQTPFFSAKTRRKRS